jgi:hypothetical protein
MTKDELRQCLAREVERWCAKNYETLLSELAKAVSYEHGDGPDWYAVDVELLEREPEYVHVMVVVDNRLRRPPLLPYKPLSADFLVYRDGRVDK